MQESIGSWSLKDCGVRVIVIYYDLADWIFGCENLMIAILNLHDV